MRDRAEIAAELEKYLKTRDALRNRAACAAMPSELERMETMCSVLAWVLEN